jgi:hypothetical protein
MKTSQQWTILIICLALLVISVKITSDNRQLHQQITAQKEFIEQREALIDSLHGELFNANNIIGRTELSLDHLNEVHPAAFIEYSRFYDHETE